MSEGDPSAEPVFLDLLGDDEMGRHAAWAVGESGLGSPAAVDALCRRLARRLCADRDRAHVEASIRARSAGASDRRTRRAARHALAWLAKEEAERERERGDRIARLIVALPDS